ncbi:MAG TPA: vitamin K epoxide reductase family protein [Pyrinomonadaceae bacterium]|nr:vitamin K epoxide reductase family protein [Pyrinomonadaceae bacterium]
MGLGERKAQESGTVPRERGAWLFYVAALVSLAGLTDAVYLTIGYLTGADFRCTITSGCNEVLGSSYASIGGMPLAALGALAYFAVFSLATLAAFNYRRAVTALKALVASMLLVTFWLLYLQAFVIHHYCQYCLFSAAIVLALNLIIFIAPLLIKRGQYHLR